MGAGRLHPENLKSIPAEHGAILSDHTVRIAHVAGSALGRRKGRYEIEIIGPRCFGKWIFASGQLEKLARAAALTGQ